MKKLTDDQIIAKAVEILQSRFKRGPLFSQPDEVATYLGLKLADRKSEVFSVLFMDNRQRMIEFREMFLGTVNQSHVSLREIVRVALELNAAILAFAHNHPSGDPSPSRNDITLTRKLAIALSLFDIEVIDHIIVGAEGFFSFAEHGLI